MRFKFRFLLFQYFALAVNSEQKNVSSAEFFNTTVNDTKQQGIIGRNFVVINNKTTNKIKKMDDFRPSPQFGGFENTFPNQESKTFDFLSNKNWFWSKNSEKSEETSIEAPWRYSKVKFPTPAEKPSTGTNPIELPYNYPPPTGKPTIIHAKQPDSMWNKFLSFTGLNMSPKPSPKSFYSDQLRHSSYHGVNHLDPSTSQFGSSDHGSYHRNSLDHYNNDYYSPVHYHPEEHYGGAGGISPWKKILKIIATVIPLGLLLSALTPTIITVSPSNDTESRFNRKDIGTEMIMEKVANSLNHLQKLQQEGCEQKVFCELMINAMLSKNAEDHIKNLLDNFAKGSGLNETSFTKVLEAVKNRDCSPIICKDMKDPT